MQRPVTSHPADETLVSYGLGKLDETVAIRIDKHLEQCPPCRQKVAELSTDSFVERLRNVQVDRDASEAQRSDPEQQHLSDQPADSGTFIPTNASPTGSTIVPELVDHEQYTVIRELGRGGMGVVYLVRNRLMDRLEVLKVLNKEMVKRKGAADRFLREIKSAAKLQHPNVVAAYNALRIQDLLVLAMEYVDGDDLAKLVKSRGPLPVVNACYFIYQAAQGLQHAHERGMIHRDIKPGNLILFRDGKKAIVKILDFGLAKVTREEKVDRTLTHEGQMLGTPDYIAPEQTLDAQSADIRADIYSLGCTLYHLLAGSPPFNGNSLYEVLQSHQSVEAKRLNLVRSEVPVELAAVVARMMAKAPESRYQTPADVALALRPFLKPGGAYRSQPELSEASGRAKGRLTESGSNDGSEPALAPMPVSQPAERWRSLIDVPDVNSSPFWRLSLRRRSASKHFYAVWGAIAIGSLLAIFLFAWANGVLSIRTKEGVIVLEQLPEDAEVLVDGERVTVQWPGGGSPAEISVPAGKRGLEIKKDGFQAFGQDVSVANGDRTPLKVNLEPLPSSGSNQVTTEPAAPSANELFSTPEVARGDWSIVNGELIQSSLAGGWNEHPLLIFGDPNWENYDLTLEFQKIGHGAAKICFHAQGENNRCWYSPSDYDDGRGCELAQYHNGHWDRAPGNFRWHSNTPEVGKWYSVKLEIRGSHFKSFLNGQLQFEHRDPRFTKGRIGLSTWTTACKIRNIRVTSPSGAVLWAGFPDISSHEPDQKPRTADPEHRADGFVPLFNGKDLTGWEVHPSQPGDWRVEDGAIACSGALKTNIYTEREYRDFHFRAEVLISDNGNSGIFGRSSFGPVSPAENPKYVRAYEADINTTHGRDKTGSLMMLGFTKGSAWDSETPADQWFWMEMIAQGSRITIKVNNKTTVSYTDEKAPFHSGRIGLQHNPNCVVKFRSIEIKELLSDSSVPEELTKPEDTATPTAPTQSPVNSGFAPLFNGTDLTGWTAFSTAGNWSTRNNSLVSAGKGGWIGTDQEFSDFELELEYKLPPGGNSGVFLRTLDKLGAKKQGLESIEVQLLDDTAPKHRGSKSWQKNGSIYGIIPASPLVISNANEWNKLTIILKGLWITVKVNDVQVVDASLDSQVPQHNGTPDLNRRSGRIGLQDHGLPVEFRNIVIKEIPGNASANKTSAKPKKSAGKPTEKAVSLFNGKDLSSWNGDLSVWKVENGAIVAHSENDLTDGNKYLVHQGNYTDFELTLEFLLANQGNSGVQFRSTLDPTGRMQGYQAELGFIGDGSIIGDLYEEAGRGNLKRLDADMRQQVQAKWRNNDWNSLLVRCIQSLIIVEVNGVRTVEMSDAQGRRSGFIALQSHHKSKPQIAFRNIRIKELKPAAPADGESSEEDLAAQALAKLSSAESRFQQATHKADERLRSQFDAQIRKVATLRVSAEERKLLADALEQEKDRFSRKRLLPWSLAMRTAVADYSASMTRAGNDLAAEFDKAIARGRKSSERVTAVLMEQKSKLLAPRVIGRFEGTGTTFKNAWTYNLYSDGTVDPDKPEKKTWSFDGDVLVIRIIRPVRGDIVDRCSISPDGKTLDAVNNRKDRYTGRFIE